MERQQRIGNKDLRRKFLTGHEITFLFLKNFGNLRYFIRESHNGRVLNCLIRKAQLANWLRIRVLHYSSLTLPTCLIVVILLTEKQIGALYKKKKDKNT